jgi:lactate dehydrogenase-like 2-hydroxyacid dehydrogenase
MRPRVFVVQPIPEVGLEVLHEYADVEVYPHTDQQISVDDLIGAAKRSDYIFAMHETAIPASVLEANPNLKGIVGGRNSLTIDVEACDRFGVPLLHDPNRRALGVSRATADLTVAMILNLAYRIREADAYTRAGGFRQEMAMDLMGIGCSGKTAGLIGLGKVGRFMVPRLRASNMRVLYTKRTRLSPEDERQLGVEWVASKDDILQRSDFVCMECDYNSSTHKMIGERELSLMQPTAFFINTGRGRLVDEPALIRALQAKTIAGAGLDVFWDEPPETHDPHIPVEFCKMDNVVLAPHNGGATWQTRGEMVKSGAELIVAAINRAAALVTA